MILSVPKHKVKNTNGSSVLGFEVQQQKASQGYIKAIKNPSKLMLGSGKYYPRLTGFKRYSDYSVKIEFSVPKLLFGNNVEELCSSS
jgi:hypothetical protein